MEDVRVVAASAFVTALCPTVWFCLCSGRGWRVTMGVSVLREARFQMESPLPEL